MIGLQLQIKYYILGVGASLTPQTLSGNVETTISIYSMTQVCHICLQDLLLKCHPLVLWAHITTVKIACGYTSMSITMRMRRPPTVLLRCKV